MGTASQVKPALEVFNELDTITRELSNLGKLLNVEFYKTKVSLGVRTDAMKLEYALDYVRQYREESDRLISIMTEKIKEGLIP